MVLCAATNLNFNYLNWLVTKDTSTHETNTSYNFVYIYSYINGVIYIIIIFCQIHARALDDQNARRQLIRWSQMQTFCEK
jgi:hypothetical protein